MKTSALISAAFAATILAASHFQIARPNQSYQFPRDHFSHPDYQTEWWYYTGNLRDTENHRYGFELTFFRQAVDLSAQQLSEESKAWQPSQVYLAHLAFTDIDGKRFYHTERLNRAGPGLAGAQPGQCWNGNWSSRWSDNEDGRQVLQAVSDQLGFDMQLNPAKPLVVNGRNGISRKGPEPGQASHYITFTRLHANGTVHWNGRTFQVAGLAWMDHEYFTGPKNADLAGWDWFSVQLSNRTEVMLYRLRSKSGQVTPFSSGTFVDASGQSRFLSVNDFSVTPAGYWRSPRSHANYPIGWQIAIPSLKLDLAETALLPDQELFSTAPVSPTYWEGAVAYTGKMGAAAITGVGYLELTGYGKPLSLASTTRNRIIP